MAPCSGLYVSWLIPETVVVMTWFIARPVLVRKSRYWRVVSYSLVPVISCGAQ